jgi:hypothetical protein
MNAGTNTTSIPRTFTGEKTKISSEGVSECPKIVTGLF